MKLASSILLGLYALLMLLPLFSKKVSNASKLSLIGCEMIALLHLILYFNGRDTIWTLLLCLFLFQLFSLFQGLKLGKVHWLHQGIRFILHSIIYVLYLF